MLHVWGVNMPGWSMCPWWPPALHFHSGSLVSLQAAQAGEVMEDDTDIMHHGRRLQV